MTAPCVWCNVPTDAGYNERGETVCRSLRCVVREVQAARERASVAVSALPPSPMDKETQ
jgi:hypothetical protein